MTSTGVSLASAGGTPASSPSTPPTSALDGAPILRYLGPVGTDTPALAPAPTHRGRRPRRQPWCPRRRAGPGPNCRAAGVGSRAGERHADEGGAAPKPRTGERHTGPNPRGRAPHSYFRWHQPRLSPKPGDGIGAACGPGRHLQPGSGMWVVRPGDDLWSIAAATLTRAWGHRPAEADLARYWWQVVQANRANLPDQADPSLLFPGDRVAVPAPPLAPH